MENYAVRVSRWLFCGMVAGVFAACSPAAYASVINGDFETGDLTGWTTFTTQNGTLGSGFPNVVLFDTNNNTIQSLAAQFRVGQVNFQTGVQEGGGLFQNVNLSTGTLNISVDIASLGGPQFTNAAGGRFGLLLDGVLVDQHDFGTILSGVSEHSMLATITGVTAGLHEIRLRITRPFLQGSTPTQYIDNVVLSGSAVVIPEPSSIVLFGLGTVGLVFMKRRRRKRKMAA